MPCGVVTPWPDWVVTLMINAGLASVFGRRRARDHLHGLDRIERNLVGEHLALLVGDGLAVNENEFSA